MGVQISQESADTISFPAPIITSRSIRLAPGSNAPGNTLPGQDSQGSSPVEACSVFQKTLTCVVYAGDLIIFDGSNFGDPSYAYLWTVTYGTAGESLHFSNHCPSPILTRCCSLVFFPQARSPSPCCAATP